MSKTLDQFLPHVLPWVNGCTDLMAYQALRVAAINFCKRTDVVQDIQPISTIADQQDYTLTIPADMQLQRVLGVGFQGTWLDAVAPGSVMSDVALRGVAIGNASLAKGSPQSFFQKIPTAAQLSLYPVPDQYAALAGGLTVKCSYIPTLAAATLHDTLYDEWANAIAAGALKDLVSMPDQPFSQPSLAATYRDRYETAVVRCRHQVFNGKVISSLRVQPRAF